MMKAKLIQHQRKEITQNGINGVVTFDFDKTILANEETELNGSIPCCIYKVDLTFNNGLKREVLRLYNTEDKRIIHGGKIFDSVYAYNAKKRFNPSDILLESENSLFFQVAEWINKGFDIYWNIVKTD